MRILFIAPYIPSLIRVRPYNFIRELSARHEITLLATGPRRDSLSEGEVDRFCEAVHIVPLSIVEIVRNCSSALLGGEQLQAAFCRSYRLEKLLEELLAVGRFDVVHVEHLRAAWVGRVIPSRVPTVFDSVDCISLLLERTARSSHSPIQRVLATLELEKCRRYEAATLKRFPRTAVTSPEDAAALKTLENGAAVSVIRNGVDLDYFSPLDGDSESSTLVFSGKMSYHANVSAVLHFVRHILPAIRVSHPEVKLRVIGSNPPSQVVSLARDPNITVTGYLPDIRLALGSGTVAVCPVTVKVGIQNKVLEAMAMGVPVVATTEGTGGLDAVPGRDLLVAHDPAEFASHVVRLLDSADERRRLSAGGRKYVAAHHRWGVVARQLEAIHNEAMATMR